jgi:uncharacterized protein YcbK (DUF882 family)
MNINAEERIQLRENFYLDEFVNTMDGNKLKGPDPALLDALQFVRNILGPMTVTSGYRSKEFNDSVRGSKNSYHLTGKAADFTADFKCWHKTAVVKVFKAAGFKNVKFYYSQNRHIRCHVDVGIPWDKSDFCVLANKYE